MKKKAVSLIFLMSSLIVSSTAMAEDEDSDSEFIIIDSILGRESNKFEKKWEGVYFGLTISQDDTQFDFNFTSLVDSSDSDISDNRYDNVLAGSLVLNRTLLGITLGENYLYDSGLLVGVEGILTRHLDGSEESHFASPLLFALPNDMLNAPPATTKGSREEQNYSDSIQTDLLPVIGVFYNNGLDVRVRLGYVDDDIHYYSSLGYTSAVWFVEARANVSTSVSVGSNQPNSFVNREIIVRGWSVGFGIEYAFTRNLFGRLEFISNNYQQVTSDHNSNQISFSIQNSFNTTAFNTSIVYSFD